MSEAFRKYRFPGSLILLFMCYSVAVIMLKTSEKPEQIIVFVPFMLLFTTILLLANHSHWNRRVAFILILITALGFLVELTGVRTGVPFGFYSYSDVLGVKFLGTPLVMGIHWGMLVYAGTMVLYPLRIPGWLKPILTGLLLTVLDVFIEPFAGRWNLWKWQETVPLAQNYLSWAIVTMLLSWVLHESLARPMRNKLAFPILLMQLLFFVFLSK